MTAHRLVPFAQQLKRYRRERGLTQEELAELAGLSARGIRALELGERGTPHKGTVRLLAEALGLSPDQWVSFDRAAAVTVIDAARGGPTLPIGGFLGAVPAGPIIARQHEVSHLLSLLDEVTGGAGRLVMLAGEPGVGKTRLAQEVTVTSHTRGFLVASGRCYEPEQSVSYYPFLEALTALYHDAPASIRAEVPHRWSYLEWLLPGRPRVVSPTEMGRQDVQQWLFAAVSGFLQAVAATAPVALMLDDLHWADESSLKLLQYLARQTRASRVLMLGTYRDTELARVRPLERALRDIHREGLLEEISVRRLEQQGTAALAAALLGEAEMSEEFARLVHEHTDGNPFFTQEVMRDLVERGDVFQRDGVWDRRTVEEIEVPRSVRSAIGERVSHLSELTQKILREASVLGQVFSFADLWRMGDRSEEEVDEALEEALAAMLVRLTDTDEYSFNHALTQQTLYSELSPRRRHRLHGAVGEALEQLSESVRRVRATQLAWHYLQADKSERALPYALLAGDEAAAISAHGEAEEHYRTSVELAQELSDQVREVEGLEKLGIERRIVGRYDDALEVLGQAAEMCRSVDDIEGEGRATLEMAFVHYYQGTLEQGLSRIQKVTERVEHRSPAARRSHALADLYTALSALSLWPTARYCEALCAAERAAEFARTEDYTRSRGIAETLRGMALTMVGPLPEACVVLEEATSLCAASGDTWWTLNSVGNIGRAYLDAGEFGKASEYLERSRALIDAKHDQAEMAWMESNIGEASYLRGNWADARDKYEGAIRTARDVGAVRYLSYALLHLAELGAAEGKWDEANQHIEEGLEIARRCSAIPTMRKGQRLLAEHDLVQGRAEDAVTRLQSLLESSEDDWPRAFPPPVLAEAYLALGDGARAEELVQHRVQRFQAQNHRRALALWLRVQGMILGRERRWDEADQIFAEAVSLARAMPYPYAEGRSHYDHGLLHIQHGESEQARERLKEALAIFSQLRARPSVERTEHALHDLR